MIRTSNKKDNRTCSTHTQSISNQISSRSHSQDGVKDVEPKVQSNSRLQRARFYGVTMQRRSSLSERSLALSRNNADNNKQEQKTNPNTDKSQQMILSAQVFPSSEYQTKNQTNSILNDVKNIPRSNSISHTSISLNKSFSKRNDNFIRNDSPIEAEAYENKKKSYFSRRKIVLCTAISLLVILLIVLSVVLPLKLSNSKTTTPSNQSISQNLSCTSGGLICSTLIFQWNYYCTPTSYNYYSCCYLSPSSTQLTIEFVLQEDISHWSIDDVSATQNNGELITNGGFESNLNGWNLTIPSNATSATYVSFVSSSSHSGLAYLYGGSQNAPAYLQQTFNVIQGQDINISFWWADGGSSVFIPGKICRATVTLT